MSVSAVAGVAAALAVFVAFELDVGDAAVWGPTGDGRREMRGSGAASGLRLIATLASEQILPFAVQ